MERSRRQERAPIGAVLAIVGGALLAVGSFLPWAEVLGGGASVSAQGVDGSDGYVTLGAGLIALVVGVLMTKQAKRAFAVLAVLAGLIGGGLGVYDALTVEDSVLDAAAEEIAPTLGASEEEVRAVLVQAVDSSEIAISISLGLYVVIGGGIVALIGGLLGMRGTPVGGAAEPGPDTHSAISSEASDVVPRMAQAPASRTAVETSVGGSDHIGPDAVSQDGTDWTREG